MYNPNPVLDSGVHFVQRDDILRIVIPDLHQIPDLTVRTRWNLHTDLNIDPLIAAYSDEINLFSVVLSDINIISAAFQFEKHDILDRAVKHLTVVSEQRVFQGNVGKIIFFLRLEYALALKVVAFAWIDYECLLKPADIVVDALDRDFSILAFKEA